MCCGAEGRAYIFARHARRRGASSSISAVFAQSSVYAALRSATLSRSPAMNSRSAMCRSSTATIARQSCRARDVLRQALGFGVDERVPRDAPQGLLDLGHQEEDPAIHLRPVF